MLLISYHTVMAVEVNSSLSLNNSNVNLPRHSETLKTTQNPNARFVVNKKYPKKEKVNKNKSNGSIKKSKRQTRRELRSLKKEFKKNRGKPRSKSNKIILTVLVTLGMIYGWMGSVATLAFALAYIGLGAAAITALILGTALIIWALHVLLKKIWK